MDKLVLWENGEDLLKDKKTTMDNIVTFAKNLVLSSDEKILREMGLKSESGDYTPDAMRIVMQKLADDNKLYLIGIAKKAKAEKDSKK